MQSDVLDEIGSAHVDEPDLAEVYPAMARMVALGIPEDTAEEIALSNEEVLSNTMFTVRYGEDIPLSAHSFNDKKEMLSKLADEVQDCFFDDNSVETILIDGVMHVMSVSMTERTRPYNDADRRDLSLSGFVHNDIVTGKFVVVVGRSSIISRDRLNAEGVADRVSKMNNLLPANDASIAVFHLNQRIFYDWKIILTKKI